MLILFILNLAIIEVNMFVDIQLTLNLKFHFLLLEPLKIFVALEKPAFIYTTVISFIIMSYNSSASIHLSYYNVSLARGKNNSFFFCIPGIQYNICHKLSPEYVFIDQNDFWINEWMTGRQ